MTDRIGDAMRRGALTAGLDGAPDVDFMAVDWFELADQRLDELQERFGLTPKSEKAVSPPVRSRRGSPAGFRRPSWRWDSAWPKLKVGPTTASVPASRERLDATLGDVSPLGSRRRSLMLASFFAVTPDC